MRDPLLVQLNNDIYSMIRTLDRIQSLALAGLSISRLWTPYVQWAVQNKAPKLVDYGEKCLGLLWKQIFDEQIYGSGFEEFYRYSEKIQDKINKLEDKDIIADGSIAWPFMESLDSALCCFYDPKLLPGLQRISFEQDIMVMVGQASSYLYDYILANTEYISEEQVISIVGTNTLWEKELTRIKEDVILVKSFPLNKGDVLKQRDSYITLNIFESE